MKVKSFILLNIFVLFSCKLFSQNTNPKFGTEFKDSFSASAKAQELSKYYIQICPNPEGKIDYTSHLLNNFNDKNLQEYLKSIAVTHIFKEDELNKLKANGLKWTEDSLPLIIVVCPTHKNLVAEFYGAGKPDELKEIIEIYLTNHFKKYPHK